MADQGKRESSAGDRSSQGGDTRPSVSSRFEQFEKRQKELWNLTFLLLLVLAVVFAVVSWDSIRSLSKHFEALPIGLVVLVVLFSAYMWKKTQEISELRGLMRGIEQRDAAPPSEKQIDQLFTTITRSQQGFRDLIDSFDDVLIALSLEGEIRAVNRSFSDLVGVSFQQIIGKHITDFVEEGSGDGQELVHRNLPRFLERRTWSGLVQIRLKKELSLHYFDCVAHAMVRDDKVHGLTILARDITALRKSEARFTELFETLQEGIYITTPDGQILDANPALVRMLGYDSKDELLSKKVSELLTSKEERKLLKEEVERQSTVQGREVTLQHKDGHPVICLNTAAAVRDSSGAVIRYQGAVMDITARREIEHRLHQQQEFARRLIDGFPDLILVLDTDSRFTFVSPRCKEILGYELEETREMKLGGRTHPEDLPALLSLYGDIVAGRQTFASLEVRVRHKLGEWRRIRFNFSPLFDEAGKIDGVVMSGRDVTELKRLEEQLIQAEKLAAMGQMLAGVAHELNNPLTAILGVTELLSERGGLEEDTKRQLDLTHRQARRAARIVQNLLDFSRPAAPQKKTIDVNTLIERTLQLHEHSLRRNNIEVEFHRFPEAPGVIGDANQLIQVFLNLITNAEYAIREVRDSGRIQIRLARDSSRIAVTFQDDGVGIRPEAFPRLFDPFYTTKRPGGGTGLGLSICMAIVREHGGTLEAEALPAGGSAFTVYLPIAGESVPSAPEKGIESSHLQSAPPTLAVLRGRSILVLDDEESIRMLLDEGLSAQGMRVDCAATPDEALALISQRPYDALLCDLNLTAGGGAASGSSAAQRILAASGVRKPTVIYMTGDFLENGDGEPKLGEPRHLQKPFRMSDVFAILRDAFSFAPAEKTQN
ncbi:MAG TPA: PAS domain S-box protein [Candidatus Limnocylindria bacterium]|nr:PAS domain S-box protein [Candidatus Limnocylindria bacterium]